MAIREVRFSLSAILKLLKDIFGASSPAGSTSTTSDSLGIAQRPVNDYVILQRWDQIVLELKRFNFHLFLLTGFDGIEENSIPNILKKSSLQFIGEVLVPFRGALVTDASVQTIGNSSFTAINFDTETKDTDDIHDNSTNNTRLTVPSGVTIVRLYACIAMASGAGGRAYRITKGGSTGVGQPRVDVETTFNAYGNLVSGPLDVVATNYFEVEVFQNTGGDLDTLNADGVPWFAMEILE